MSIVKVLTQSSIVRLPRGLAILGSFLLSFPASALDCTYKIVRIQAETDKVLVQVVLSPALWINLGSWSLPATRPYLAIAQQAVAMDRSVMLRFTDAGVCDVRQLTDIPIAIRLNQTE